MGKRRNKAKPIRYKPGDEVSKFINKKGGKRKAENSIFGVDPCLAQPDEPNEWDKAYNGEPSDLDLIDWDDQMETTPISSSPEIPSLTSPPLSSDCTSGSTSSPSVEAGSSTFFDDDTEELPVLEGIQLPDSYISSEESIRVCQGCPLEDDKPEPTQPTGNRKIFDQVPDLEKGRQELHGTEDVSSPGVFDTPLCNLDGFQPAPPGRMPVTPASANTDLSEDEEKEEAKNLALRLAVNFCQNHDVIQVGKGLYLYNGSFYSLLDDHGAKQMVFNRYRGELNECGSPLSVIQSAAALLEYCVERRLEVFPINENLIVFPNGTLEINTLRFRANSPSDLASSALGIAYDPNRKKMPATKHFLETIAHGDQYLYLRMLQVIGFLLSNDTKAKSFVYLQGVGDAGKSRFCDLIASFFPEKGPNKVARVALQDLGGQYALANLVNAKLNISEDLPDAPLTPTTVSRIKMLSDSNRLEAEAKYVQSFSFRPLCKLLFASNHPLRLKEYDAAFVNRVVYLPFLHAIPREKQDRNILEKMRAELPALFNHAIEAYRQLVADGYAWAGGERFKPDITVTNSTISVDKHLMLKQFVSTCLEFDAEAITATCDLQIAYHQFCDCHKCLPIAGDRFSRELFSLLPWHVERIKIGNQRRGFQGVRLKTGLFQT